MLAGTSLTKQTDMANALTLKSGDEPVGIRVCERQDTDSIGRPLTETTNPDNTPIYKIVGIQMIYGYVGPRCSYTSETTEQNGGYKLCASHGVMEGTCKSYYFDGKEIASISVYSDGEGSVQGLRFLTTAPESTDERRMLQDAEPYEQAIEVGTVNAPG